ncbi:MAG: YicC family protein [Blastocatellia bacterium]|nr:YicC family protein [Blastocatellia bacterium]
MKSMTGFGKGGFEGEDFSLQVEIRTVNNRFLDIHARLPQELNGLEAKTKKQIQSALKRGRVDVTVTLTQTLEVRYDVNLPLIRGYVSALRQAQEATSVEGTLDLSLIARLPGAIQPATGNPERDERLAAGLTVALAKALENLEAMRETEGRELAGELERRLDGIVTHTVAVAAGAAQVTDAYRQKLARRMTELLRDLGEVDPLRLAQEAAYYADRSDITEEIARMNSHIGQFRQILTQAGEAGKQMDFLTQEMNREANTMLSKSGDLAISQAALAIKLEIEKIKEQVQNVE